MVILALVEAAFGATPHTFAIEDHELSIDGHPIARPWAWSEFESLLGPAERIYRDVNDLHTYDVLGIVVFTDTDDTFVREIHFCYDNLSEFPINPFNPFTGSLLIEGHPAGPGKAKPMLKALEPWGWEDAQLTAVKGAKTWRGEDTGLYVYINEYAKNAISYYSVGLTSNN